MKLLYGSGNELVLLAIDRDKEELEIATSRTDYKLQKRPYTELFDNGLEKEQYENTKGITDIEFESQITESMRKAGYFKMKLPE